MPTEACSLPSAGKTSYLKHPPPHGTSGDELLDGFVEGTDALQRLRHRLRDYGLYPAISYPEGPRLHVAGDVTVCVSENDGVLTYTWKIKPGLRVAVQNTVTSTPVNDVDEAARLIAEALGRVPRPEEHREP